MLLSYRIPHWKKLQVVVNVTLIALLFLLVLRWNSFKAPINPRRQLIGARKNSLDMFCNDYFQHKIGNNKKKVVESLSIYGKCYLPNPNSACSELEAKLIPYFTGNYPIVTRYNNYTLDFENYSSGCFWPQFKAQFKGRGIVISIGKNQVKDSIRLLNVLRYLNNTLPIQFVHKGDLSSANCQQLVEVARNKSHDDNIKQQTIWFVDTSPCIRPSYLDKFDGYYNKLIAALFNTFEEMILIDSDAVPFVNPEKFFHMYNRNSFFFKDRDLNEFLSSSLLKMYKSFIPSPDLQPFGININYSAINNLQFFKYGQKHLMESGLVVMNRSSTLTGLLVSARLSFWKSTSNPVYGDKELIWLGQLFAGNGDFEFNSQNSAAIGKMDDLQSRLCSSQIGHLDSAGSLLWVNGGLQNCKMEKYVLDALFHPSLMRLFNYSFSYMREYFQDPTTIEAAIIPSSPKKIKINHRNISYIVTESTFTKDKSLGCAGRYYCAFAKGETVQILSFNKTYADYLNKVVHIWNS